MLTMDNATLMLRQVNPGVIQGDQVSSQAFRPTSKVKRRPSVYDGDQLAPRTVHEHYTSMLGFLSASVMAMSVAECGKLKLPVCPDPQPFPEHLVIDFSKFPRSQVGNKAESLRAMAKQRGWLYLGPRIDVRGSSGGAAGALP